ncbi:MAG: Rha family transcriptional regulator [Desulfobacteraceae bacterium]|nr:Rha family transcriptional regulator [Desulfobacteraceae bacterium]
MVDGLVKIINDEPRAGTWLIAKGFEREHKHILRLVSNYNSDFLDFGALKTQKSKSTGGRPVNEILLNENQTMFLGTLLRNSDIVVKFKKELIIKFDQIIKELNKTKEMQKDDKWIASRKQGKLIRLEATDCIKDFIVYAESQGSKNGKMYYTSLTRMMNGLLFIVDGKFKNLRNVMSPRQLMTVSSAEQIIEKALKKGMKNNMFYKDIYKLAKENVGIFAELHGKSSVIESLKIKE